MTDKSAKKNAQEYANKKNKPIRIFTVQNEKGKKIKIFYFVFSVSYFKCGPILY
jgi:hypothetical protein